MPSVSVVTGKVLAGSGRRDWSSSPRLAVLTSEVDVVTEVGEVRAVGDEVPRGGVELDRQRLVAAVDRHRAGGGSQTPLSESMS